MGTALQAIRRLKQKVKAEGRGFIVLILDLYLTCYLVWDGKQFRRASEGSIGDIYSSPPISFERAIALLHKDEERQAEETKRFQI